MGISISKVLEEYRKDLVESRKQNQSSSEFSIYANSTEESNFYKEMEEVRKILYGAAIKAGGGIMSTTEIPYVKPYYPFGKQRTFTTDYYDEIVVEAVVVEDTVVDDEAILEEDT